MIEKFKILSVDEVFEEVMCDTYRKGFKVVCASAQTMTLFAKLAKMDLSNPRVFEDYKILYDSMAAGCIYHHNYKYENGRYKEEIGRYVVDNKYYQRLSPTQRNMFKSRVDKTMETVYNEIERMGL